ncbi:MAG: response regulator [Bacteroidota bacterium]
MQYSRVLLIDDDEDDQELFLMAIKEIASTVECTALSSAQTALTQLETHALTTDLIFLDLNMPIMTGQQFLSELKKKEALSKIPVIILSTSSNTATINETKELGAKKFITKPSNYKELKSVLYGILT